MNGTGNMLIDEPTIYIAVIYIRYILEQSVRVDGLEYFVKHPRRGCVEWVVALMDRLSCPRSK